MKPTQAPKDYPAKRIPVSDAKHFGEKNNQTQVLILCRGADGFDHVVTWGKSVEQCDEAAIMGNRLKTMLGWSSNTSAEPSRIKKLRDENLSLRAVMGELVEALKGMIEIFKDVPELASMGFDSPPEPRTQWDYEGFSVLAIANEALSRANQSNSKR